MKAILQNTRRTIKRGTSGETCENDRASLTCAVNITVHMPAETHQYELRVANGQQNQVERLFPEFFTSCSKTCSVESYKAKTCGNGRVEQWPDDPLIQSWLNLYGGGARD